MAKPAKTVFFACAGLLVFAALQMNLDDARSAAAHKCLDGKLLDDGEAPVSAGSIDSLMATVYQSMNNPKSLQIVATQIFPRGQTVRGYSPAPQHSIASMVYRGENSFGGTVTEEVVAEINPDTCATVAVLDFGSR